MVVLSVLLQYGILTGESVSAMRAVGMFLLAVGARIAGRTYDLLTALAVSAVLYFWMRLQICTTVDFGCRLGLLPDLV